MKITYNMPHGKIFLGLAGAVMFGALLGILPVRGEGVVLRVEPSAQPTPTLAPQNAKSLTFTKVKLTAIGGDVVITNMVIENKGMAAKEVFSKVGFSGTPVYIASTALNANGLYETKNTSVKSFTIKNGSTTEVTLFGDMASSLTAYAGQRAALGLVRIETTATIEGTLPIIGAIHTINSTISLGTISVAVGPSDPGAARSLNLGMNKAIFTSANITVGSNDQVLVKTIKWNLLGSMATTDLSNVKTYVVQKGVVSEYATTISSDTKDYTATLGKGIIVDKGEIVEAYIAGDITAGSGRTVQFKLSGSSVSGTSNTYGYTVKGSSSFTGSIHTISAGTLTVNPGNLFAFQGEPKIGVIRLGITGEPIDISLFELKITTPGITNIKLWDSSGTLLAGPVSPTSSGRVSWKSTWIAPVGVSVLYVTGSGQGDFEDTFRVVGAGKTTKTPHSVSSLGAE